MIKVLSAMCWYSHP